MDDLILINRNKLKLLSHSSTIIFNSMCVLKMEPTYRTDTCNSHKIFIIMLTHIIYTLITTKHITH